MAPSPLQQDHTHTQQLSPQASPKKRSTQSMQPQLGKCKRGTTPHAVEHAQPKQQQQQRHRHLSHK